MSHDYRTGEMPLYDRVSIWIDDNRMHTVAEFEQRKTKFTVSLMDDGFKFSEISDSFDLYEANNVKRHGCISIWNGLGSGLATHFFMGAALGAVSYAIAWIFFN